MANYFKELNEAFDKKYGLNTAPKSRLRSLREATTSWFDMEFEDQTDAIQRFVATYKGTRVFEDFAASVGADVDDVIDLFADMESRGYLYIPREMQIDSEYANDDLYDIDEAKRRKLKEAKTSIDWYSMDRDDLDKQVAAIKDFVKNYRGTKVFEDFAASVGVDVDDIIDLFADLESYGIIDIPQEMQIDDKYMNNDIYESNCKLEEAKTSPEDEHENEVLRNIYHKTQRRVNAALTPEEKAVLNKYGLVRGKAPWTGADILKTNDYNGYNYTITSAYPHVAAGWDMDNDKVNLVDRARKIDNRQAVRNFMAQGDSIYDTTSDHDMGGTSKYTFQRQFNRANSAQMQKPIRDLDRRRPPKMDEAKVQVPLSSKPQSISSLLLKNKDKIDNAADLNSLFDAVSDALSSKRGDAKAKEIIAKLQGMKDHVKALTYIYNIILKGDNLGVQSRKGATSKNGKLHEAENEIDNYQKWVDFDMKRYGKISNRTQQMVKKAGYQILKDDHGDYEVAAGHFE